MFRLLVSRIKVWQVTFHVADHEVRRTSKRCRNGLPSRHDTVQTSVRLRGVCSCRLSALCHFALRDASRFGRQYSTPSARAVCLSCRDLSVFA